MVAKLGQGIFVQIGMRKYVMCAMGVKSSFIIVRRPTITHTRSCICDGAPPVEEQLHSHNQAGI